MSHSGHATTHTPPKTEQAKTEAPAHQPKPEPQPVTYASAQERAIAAGRDPQPNKFDDTGGCPGGSPGRHLEPLPKGAKAGNEGAANVSSGKPSPNQQPPRWG